MTRPTLDVEHLVFNAILSHFGTPEVELNLSADAKLSEDLGLYTWNCQFLEEKIQNELISFGVERRGMNDFSTWKTVKDIIDSISENIKNS